MRRLGTNMAQLGRQRQGATADPHWPDHALAAEGAGRLDFGRLRRPADLGNSTRKYRLMANLYKKPYYRTDPKTGERVKRLTKKWWGQYKDAGGKLKREPLATDKSAAQAMLNEIVRRVERERAGLVDPTEEERKRPISEHVDDYRRYLENKGVTGKQVNESTSKIWKVIAGCKCRTIADISAASAMDFLTELRKSGRSIQTRNHYLTAVKAFTRWLVREQRNNTNPLAHVQRLNVQVDRRHDRRAMSQEELSRLIEATRVGPRIEGVAGRDRAMMYLFAAYTGFRKGEIGSLTIRSLCLDGDPPTATVEACYSKSKRKDVQVLHPDLVAELRRWLDARDSIEPCEPLFPVSDRVPGGTDRKTNKMIQRDLAVARDAWIEEAATSNERQERERSDFLAYCDASGRYVDFHSLRHYFITSLERAGVSPRMAQTLARHSDIRLTMSIYTHVELHDQTAAIGALEGVNREAHPRMRASELNPLPHLGSSPRTSPVAIRQC